LTLFHPNIKLGLNPVYIRGKVLSRERANAQRRLRLLMFSLRIRQRMVITPRSRRYAGGMVAWIYLPIIRIVNDPGTGAPRAPRPPPGGGGGAGPRSSLIVKMWFVLLSNAIVRAPFIVCRFCSTSKVVGLFSLTTVSVPLPCVLNASIVAGLNTAPSEPPASGSVARILPSSACRMTIIGCGGLARGGSGPGPPPQKHPSF